MDGILGTYKISTNEKGITFILVALEKDAYKELIKDAENCNTNFDVNKFKDKYNYHPSDIIMHGETEVWKDSNNSREATEPLLKAILPKPVMVNDPINKIARESYKCWCMKNLNIPDICNHRTAWDSWRCLMDRINHPKYCIVVKQKPTTK